MTDTLFDKPDQGEEVQLVNNSYVETLVGEDKKYKDAESLAKATLEKEKHIKRIEEENAKMREKFDKTETIEELLAKQQQMFNNKQESNVEPSKQETTPAENAPKVNPVNEQDISALVNQELEKRTAQQTKATNLNTVKSEMEKAFGGEAFQVWNKIKESSSLSEEMLRDLASKSPQSVLQLAKATDFKQQAAPVNNLFGATIDPSKVSAQTPTLPSDAKPNSFWKELKKANGNVLSAQQTRERLNARLALGDKFWD